MKLPVWTFSLLLLLSVLAWAPVVDIVEAAEPPEQIHLAVTGNSSEMVVTWVTPGPTPTSTVQYDLTPGTYAMSASGGNHTYTDGGWVGELHDVILTGLAPGQQYYYRVGDAIEGWSSEHTFTTPPSGPAELVFGAFGQIGRADQGLYTALAGDNLELAIIPGDTAYAGSNQSRWDQWFNQIEFSAAQIPWMIVPGNNDENGAPGFTPYEQRLRMPGLESGSNSDHYYSFNHSGIHFVGISTEDSYAQGSNQYNWIEQDLVAADQDRVNNPWIVAYMHETLYGTSTDTYHHGNPTRRANLEHLFDSYSVDIVIHANTNGYERSHGVVGGSSLQTGPDEYLNPPLVSVIAGAASGTSLDTWETPAPEHANVRIAEYGYARFHLHSNNSMQIQYVRTSDGATLDDGWIHKVPRDELPGTVIREVIASGATWSYNETDPQPATSPAWNEPGFDDAPWPSGSAPLGFDPGPTVFGTTLADNDAGYFFRTSFNLTVSDLDEIRSVNLSVAADNGAEVWVNGGSVENDAGSDHDFDYWNRMILIPISALQEGENVVAVYLSNGATSADAYLDLHLELRLLGPPADVVVTVNDTGSGNEATLDWAGYREALNMVEGYHVWTATSPFTDTTSMTAAANFSAGIFSGVVTGLVDETPNTSRSRPTMRPARLPVSIR